MIIDECFSYHILIGFRIRGTRQEKEIHNIHFELSGNAANILISAVPEMLTLLHKKWFGLRPNS